MICYALACAQGHSFESWFQNSAAYDKQKKRGLVSCPICGDLGARVGLLGEHHHVLELRGTWILNRSP